MKLGNRVLFAAALLTFWLITFASAQQSSQSGSSQSGSGQSAQSSSSTSGQSSQPSQSTTGQSGQSSQPSSGAYGQQSSPSSGQSSQQGSQSTGGQNLPQSAGSASAPDRSGNQIHATGGAAEMRNQDRISREVRHELVMLPYYSVFDDLAYSVNGDTVTLYGSVSNPTLKKDAENVVKKIEGVEHVDNRINALPPSPMDDQLRIAEYRAIYSKAPLQKYGWGAVPSIHIIVNNGRVTLTGVVDNQSDKDLANIAANGVPGVFGVQNNLQVANQTAQ